jgi:hypothetical protein
MIPYYPRPLPGELLYSATARALAVNPAANIHRAAELLLGSTCRRFGHVFPQNVASLRENVPAVVGLTDAIVLRGSLHAAVAPFIETEDHDALLRSILMGGKSGPNFLSKNGGFALRYCPQCAREDVSAGIPFHWRTVHQHPACNDCGRHGVQLVSTGLNPGNAWPVFNARDFIDPSAPTVPSLTGVEADLGRELAWLINENQLRPGLRRIQTVLTAQLRMVPELAGQSNCQLPTSVVSEVRKKFGDAVLERVGCGQGASGGWLWVRKALCRDDAAPIFQRYSILARVAGITLVDLLRLAAGTPCPVALADGNDAELAKRRLIEFKDARPTVLRRSFPRVRRDDAMLIKKLDPKWYQETFPTITPRRPNAAAQAEHDERWRDKIIDAYVDEIKAQEGRWPTRIYVHTMSKRSNFFSGTWSQLRKNLTKTRATMQALAETDEEFTQRRARFSAALFKREGRCFSFETFKAKSVLAAPCARCNRADQIARNEWRSLSVSPAPLVARPTMALPTAA